MSDTESDKENSRMVTRLKGVSNHYIWNRLIKLKLASKDLIGISTYNLDAGVEPEDYDHRTRVEPKPVVNQEGTPEEIQRQKKELASWQKKFFKALALIITTIHPDVLGDFDAINDPAQVLVHAQITYGSEYMVSQVDIREQINNTKYDIHMCGDKFFAKLETLFHRLEAMGVKTDDQTKISTILSMFKGKEFISFKDSLTPQIKPGTKYNYVVSQFKIHIRRKQEEMEIDTAHYAQQQSSRGRGGNRGRGGSNRGSHSGGGHSGGGNHPTGGGNSQKKCFNCGKIGHISPDCPTPKPEAEQIAKLEERLKKLKEKKSTPTGTGDKADGKGASKRDNETIGGDEEKNKKARIKC